MDAKQFPARPNLEQYKKQAKDFLKACKSGDLEAIQRIKKQHRRSKKHSDFDSPGHKFTLAEAQFVIAREHEFENWHKFAKHIEAVMMNDPRVLQFESAADAIVAGDDETLKHLLRENPKLVHARSTRTHRATLLHYISANGVEDFRQKSPKNAIEIARILLEAGAEVDATSDSYGGKWDTTMNLLVSSYHPSKAGVQPALVDILVDFGAAINGVSNDGSPLITALAFHYPEAAEALARRGARVDTIVAAAGLGHVDAVESFFNADGTLKSNAPLVEVGWLRMPKTSKANLDLAFVWAAMHNRINVVELLLKKGVDPGARDYRRWTALHWAGYYGYKDIVELLLRWNAPLEVENEWGGTVLDQTLWETMYGDFKPSHLTVIEMLLDAGARVPPGWLRFNLNPSLDERVAELIWYRGVKPSVSDSAKNLLRQARQAGKEKRPADVKADLLEAVALLRTEGPKEVLAKVLRNLAELERDPAYRGDALRHYEEAVAAFREVDDPLNLAHTVRHLGDIHHEVGHTALAESCYQEALTIYRSNSLTSPNEFANAIRRLAILREEAGAIEKAKRVWREAHDFYETAREPMGIAESAARLALIAHQQGDVQKAHEWLSKATDAADESGDIETLKYMREVSSKIGK